MTAVATAPSACWSCGCATADGWKFCGDCGCDLAAPPGDWQAGIYLGRGRAALYQRAPHEIRALLPLLLAPFRHLNAIPANRWRWIFLTAVMGLFPLALISIVERTGDSTDGFKAVAFYFAALWALFFASAFRAAGLSWRLSILTFFGTTIVSMTLLLTALSINLEAVRDPFINAASLVISIPSSILFIGFPEETTKALVLFAIWRWAKQLPTLRAFMYYGILAGLGFGIQEGIGYVLGPYTVDYNKSHDVATFLFEIMLRLSSLPFFHATWTGIAAFLIWFSARVPSARAGLIFLAILIPATFHGFYDGLVGPHVGWALLVVGLSTVLLGIYAASAAQFERWFGLTVDDSDEPQPIRVRPAVASGAP
ncbi:MAG TPA: PrsW family glutamic-type intramembrane protease [Candidatus Elarobacter sp.]|jgi:RsiW-degrading membrane proteinase PrsW (M82 family)|nr:PrsW family glutamic-type intramembrane protease [Candidatus Elarobacter sp.]